MKPLSLSPAQLRVAEIAFWLALASSFFLLPDKLTLMSQIMIFGLFAVSLDMALGYAGILTVGHAAFFGAGAYAAGLLAKYGWSEPFTGLAFALAVCGLLGYVLSYLVVRGADLTRLMITIGVCVLLFGVRAQGVGYSPSANVHRVGVSAPRRKRAHHASPFFATMPLGRTSSMTIMKT